MTVTMGDSEMHRRAKLISQIWAVLIAMTIVMIGMVVVSVRLAASQDDLAHQADVNYEETLKNREVGWGNRAVACQQSVLAGATVLPSACFLPEVSRYYQPPPGVGQIPQRDH